MEAIFLDLVTPEDNLPNLSFCEADAASLADWVANLPMANTIDSAKQLHRAVTELGRLATDPANRLDLLEGLRPSIHYICARLDRTAAGATHSGEGLAQLAQHLQAELSTGYKALIRDAVATGTDKQLIGQAVHRSISDASRTMLRACQFYTAMPKRTWLEINQLFGLAEQLQIVDQRYPDAENYSTGELSISDVFLRIAMLATAKPNQLRPQHLTAIFNSLELWTPELSLGGVDSDVMFVVDLSRDAPPRYRAVADTEGETLRGIRTEVLVYQLEAFLSEIATEVPVPDFVSEDLLGHVVRAWGVMKKRSFRRTPSFGALRMCVGLRTAHFYISGGVEFAEQIGTTEALLKSEINPFLDESAASTPPSTMTDVWDRAIDLRQRIPENPDISDPEKILLTGQVRDTAALEDRYPCHHAEIVDTSPAGYCVRWRSPLPTQLQSGELLAIREATDLRWCIAVNRWIQHSDQETLMGLELLSPRAIPVAVRLVRKRDSSGDYTRALLLPELEAIGQSATLITPKLHFTESQKVRLERQNVQATAQLMRRVRNAESFSQFTFRMLDGYLENAQIDLNMDTLWEMIGDDTPEEPT